MKNSFRFGNERIQPMRKNPGGGPDRIRATSQAKSWRFASLARPRSANRWKGQEHKAGRSYEIALPQHDVGSEVMSCPAFEQRGSGSSEFVEQRAQLESFLGVEWEIPHGRRSLPTVSQPVGGRARHRG